MNDESPAEREKKERKKRKQIGDDKDNFARSLVCGVFFSAVAGALSSLGRSAVCSSRSPLSLSLALSQLSRDTTHPRQSYGFASNSLSYPNLLASHTQRKAERKIPPRTHSARTLFMLTLGCGKRRRRRQRNKKKPRRTEMGESCVGQPKRDKKVGPSRAVKCFLDHFG